LGISSKADGYKAWFQNGKLHRLDGPAVEYADGDKWWYENGELISKQESIKISKKDEQVVAKQERRKTTSRFAHLDFS